MIHMSILFGVFFRFYPDLSYINDSNLYKMSKALNKFSLKRHLSSCTIINIPVMYFKLRFGDKVLSYPAIYVFSKVLLVIIGYHVLFLSFLYLLSFVAVSKFVSIVASSKKIQKTFKTTFWKQISFWGSSKKKKWFWKNIERNLRKSFKAV